MNLPFEILESEMERIFSSSELKKIAVDHLGLDEEELGGADEGKPAFIKKIINLSTRNGYIDGLIDVIFMLKGESADSRIKQISNHYLPVNLAGKKIGNDIEVEKLISESAVSITYSARQKKVDNQDGYRQLIVKAIRPEFSQYKRGISRYLAHIRNLKLLKIKGVVQIVECSKTEDDIYYVVMDKARGESLQKLIKENKLEFEKIARILLALCGILIEYHSNKLTYGYLKPSKIFVDWSGEEPVVTLIPSGIHHLLSRPRKYGDSEEILVAWGSKYYFTPEQLMGESYTTASDIYSFGVVAYEVIAKFHPFPVKSMGEFFTAHLKKEPQPPSKAAPRASIPARFDDLILKCLSKLPSKRAATTAVALRSELESIWQEEKAAKEKAAGIRPATIEEFEDMAAEFLENPEVPELAEEVVNLARGAKAWERCIEVFNEAINKEEDKEVATDLLYRLASIYEGDIKDYDEAINCYKRILEISPDDEVAEAGIMDGLRILRRYDELVIMLLDKIEKEEDEQKRNSLLREVAALYEREVEEPSKALLVLLPMLITDPFDEEIVESITRLAESTGEWNEVFNSINRGLSEASISADRATKLCTLAGKWYLENLGRADMAATFFQKALSLSPSDEEALTGMSKILRAQGEYKELINILERLVDTTESFTGKKELLLQIGSIYHKNLDDVKKAEEIYRRILEKDPASEEAFTAMEKILINDERWEELVEITRNRAEHIEPTKKITALYGLAEMVETRLNDIQEAIEIHKKILDLQPDYILSLKALELLFSKTGDMKQLEWVLEKQTETASTPRQKFELLMRRAAIHEEEFMDNEKALALVDKAIEIDPKNLNALSTKARLLKNLDRDEQLVEVLEKQIEYQEKVEDKVALLNELSKLIAEKFNKYEEAIKHMETALSIGGEKDDNILRDLCDMCEEGGKYHMCAKWLEKYAEVKENPKEKSEIWVRIGNIQKEKLDDKSASIKSFQKALDYDPSNIKATEALKAAFAGKGDHGAALQMLQKELNATEGDIAKSKIYCEMGKIYRHDIKDTKKAIESYEKAFELDSTNMEAGEPLAELYREDDRWQDAIKIFEHFSSSASAMKKEKALELFLRYGEASLIMNDLQKAKEAFKKAREVDPKSGYALERYAHSVFEMEDWKEAATSYGEYLLRYGDEFNSDESEKIHIKLAKCFKELDELPRALEMAEKVIEINKKNIEAHRIKSYVHEKKHQWKELIEEFRNIMEEVDDEERFKLLVRVGDILREKLRDNEDASRSYQSALEIHPDDRAILIKLMQIYMELKKWQKVVEVVLKLAELVEEKKELSTYYKTAASLCDQYLGRKDDALSYYELAIENDPGQLKLLDNIENILIEKKDWKALEKTYLKMLDRLPQEVGKEVKANLWHKLGELYLHRMNRMADGVNAFETALKLDPSQRRWMEELADLYGDDVKYSDKAIPLNREILQLNPYRIESYNTLCRIYRKKGKYDQSWCVASTLTALGVEEEDVQELYKAYKTNEPAVAYERMNEEVWSRYLIHPSVDEKIWGIFKILEEPILKAKAQSHQSAGLKEEDKIDPAKAEEILPQTFHYAAGVLGIKMPQFYIWRKDTTIGVIFAPTYPPAIVVGGEALKEENTQTLAFIAARQLTYYMPGFKIRIFLQTGTTLSTWLLAAIRFIIPKFPLPSEYKSKVPDAVGILKKNLDPSQKELLATKVQTFMESISGGIDLKRWAYSIDYTADRAGLLLCNDMKVAMTVIRNLPVDTWFAAVKDRLAELALFSVSDEFFILREKLGIAIQTE